uniref:Adipogenin n=1 Tax=Anas platyrhynchos platyrhynchos TaxID=8840 RepID=A0A493SSR7_ANAPP
MRYPLVPLVNELTFPLLFFWFCLPFVLLLIVLIFWLQLLLNEGKFCRLVSSLGGQEKEAVMVPHHLYPTEN